MSRPIHTPWSALALFGFVVGCSSVEPGEDAQQPLLNVPGNYRLARPTPGHQAHLWAGRTDGGVRNPEVKEVLCRDCHALTDGGFEAPGTKSCERCHETQQKQHHPFDGGTEFTCLTCHPFKAKTLPARFERWPCFECHREAQADHPPITVHTARCEACHKPHQAEFTQAAECTTCHEVTLSHGAKGSTLAEKCMNCHPHHTEASVASKQCVTCHTKPTMPAAARVAPEALFKPGHTGCGSCHQAHRFEAGVAKPCESCHRGQPTIGASDHACTDCHRPHAKKAAPIGCTDSCHKEERVKHPKSKDGQTCMGCHEVHAIGGRLAKPCVACHDTNEFTAKVVHGKTVTCDDCHGAHDAKPLTQKECKSCHAVRYAEVATMAAKKPGTKLTGHGMCVDCHQQLPHGPPGEPKPCLSCHEKERPLAAKHEPCGQCHQAHSGELEKSCTSCHKLAELPGLHAQAEHQSCQKCHSVHAGTPTSPKPTASPATCKSCHQILGKKDHPTPPKECSGCHLFEAVKP